MMATVSERGSQDTSAGGRASPPLVVVYDGVCHLCQGLVRFIVERDSEARFAFAPLQSTVARRLVPADLAGGPSSVILVDGPRAYARSTAALRIAHRLGFPWKLLYGLIIVPAAIRDPVYDWVASNRYRWFGRSDVCQLPGPEIMARMVPGAFDDVDMS